MWMCSRSGCFEIPTHQARVVLRGENGREAQYAVELCATHWREGVETLSGDFIADPLDLGRPAEAEGPRAELGL